MKKYFSLVLSVLIITLSCICAYAQPQSYADAVIDRIENIEQLELYQDGRSYFTDINNDGTDEVILIYYEGMPYYVSLNSYAPEYSLSENSICSEQVFCDAYFFSGNACVGDVSVYKDGEFLTFKNTTFIVGGLPSGEPSPTKTAWYKKYKIGAKGDIILVSEASWSYYEESNQYYVKRGSDPQQGENLSTKDEAGKLMDEYEKGAYTLLYTVDFVSGAGVVYGNGLLTFDKAVEKVSSQTVQETPVEEISEETPKGEDIPANEIPEGTPGDEDIPANDYHEATGVGNGILHILLIVAIVLAIIIVAIILVIVIKRGKGQQTPKQ